MELGLGVCERVYVRFFRAELEVLITRIPGLFQWRLGGRWEKKRLTKVFPVTFLYK
jgi:hypothetical protein